MDKIEFKKLLFKVAFCTMACDGHIDEREIEEMKIMDENTTFFDSIDLSSELRQLIDDFHSKGTKVIGELFEALRHHQLNPIQELLVLEVALRIINADQKHDENEVKFIHLLRAKLELYDQTIIDRFGSVDILHTSEYAKNIVTDRAELDFCESVELPRLADLDEKIFSLGEP